MFSVPSVTWTPVTVRTSALSAPPAAEQMSRFAMSGLTPVSAMSIEKMRFPMQLPLV